MMMTKVCMLCVVAMTKAFIPSVQTIKSMRAPSASTFSTKIDSAEDLMKQAEKLRQEAKLIEDDLLEQTRSRVQAEIDSFFKLADADEDGSVTLDELRSALEQSLIENSNSPRQKRRAQELVSSEERVADLLKDLDTNADGVLQRDELVDLTQMRARLERRFKLDQNKNLRDEMMKSASALAIKTQERLDIFEGIANRTSFDARLIALSCYLLPALDALPFSLAPPGTGSNPAVTAAIQAIVSATIAFRSLPFSGVLAILALNFIGSNASASRLTRFSARHAILLDIVAVVLLPLGALVAPENGIPGTALEVAILISAVATLFGQNAEFLPLTGTYAKKFVDNFDNSVRNFLQTASAAEASLFFEGKDENDDSSSSSSSK